MAHVGARVLGALPEAGEDVSEVTTNLEALIVYPEGITELVPFAPGALRVVLKSIWPDSILGGAFARGSFLYCDEEAVEKALTYNRTASAIAGMQLFGPVVFVGVPDDAGHDTSVDPALYARLNVVRLSDAEGGEKSV